MPSLAEKFASDYNRRLKKFRTMLVQVREEAKLTQEEVAKMLGCTQSRFSKIERKGIIDFVEFERLAAIYDKEVADFLTLSSDVRKRSVHAEDEPHYEGHTRNHWKAVARARATFPRASALESELERHRREQ